MLRCPSCRRGGEFAAKSENDFEKQLLPDSSFLEAAALIQVGITEKRKGDDYTVLQHFIALTLVLLPAVIGKE